MHFAGTLEIKAPRETVWAFLVDPTQVGGCGPGVESIEAVDETHYKARAKMSVGPVSAKFNIELEAGEMIAPEMATMKAHGLAPGTALDAIGTMILRGGASGVTVVDWEANVVISGTIASLGMRLLEGSADRMIVQTFDCIRSKLEATPALAR